MDNNNFRAFCCTNPKETWYGIEEFRIKSWGTTCHPVMLNQIGGFLEFDSMAAASMAAFMATIDSREEAANEEIFLLFQAAKSKLNLPLGKRPEKITAWSTIKKDGSRVHNHIANGYSEDDIPTGTKEQNSAWKGQKWAKEHCLLINGVVY